MTSTLDLTGEEDPETGLGHGTRALGPSDSSDSGSDIVGGPGMDEGLSDEQARRMPLSTTQGAGRDIGDADLDSDSDRYGTGERGSSGPDAVTPVDQEMTVEPGIESGEDELDDPDADEATESAEDEANVSDGAT